MDQKLSSMIARYSDPSPTDFTHRLLYPSANGISISASHQGEFWKEYCDLIYQNERNGIDSNIYLAEIQPNIAPMIIICNFEFSSNSDLGEGYEDLFLLALVKSFQDAIGDTLEIQSTESEFICCVMDSEDNYIDRDRHVEIVQIRLQFPYCRLEKSVFTEIVLPEAMKNLRLNNVFSHLSQQPTNNWEEIILQFKNWSDTPMYMARHRPEYPVLKLKHIYKRITDQMLVLQSNVEPEECDIVECFFPHMHDHVSTGLVNMSTFQYNTDITFWLPMFLSVHYGRQVTLPIEGRPRNIGINSSYRNNNNSSRGASGRSPQSNNSQQANDDIKSRTQRLLNILGIHRVEKEHYWLDVGRAIYTVFSGSPEGLAIWIRFTERGESRTSMDCEYHYETFEYQNFLTHRTIAWYAREDSEHEYDRWHKSWYLPSMNEALSKENDDVAECFYKIFWLEFACASTVNGGEWYHFFNNRWNKVDNGSDLRHMVSSKFIDKFREYLGFINDEARASDDKQYKEQADIMAKKITTLISKLKNYTYKYNIVKSAADKYFQQDKEFFNKLDQNDCFLGMRNGIIEATDTEALFRKGKPEDYVAMSTGITFPESYTWDHPRVKEVKLWYEQTYIDPNILKYKMKMDASCLRGRNVDKLFPVCTGDVNNSKSMWKKLFDAAYGPYSIDFPMSVLSGKKGGGGPSPELAQARTARVAFLMEPDNGEDFRNGVLKMLTGGDSFFARFCRQDGGRTEAMFKLFLLCNAVPLIPNCDKAVKERLKIVPHLSTWVKPREAPTTLSEQFEKRLFPQDKFFDKKIPFMAPAFMWISVQMYKEYAREGLVEPKEVIEHTQHYWDENDVYLLFNNENIEQRWIDPEKTQKDPNSILSLQDIYSEFNKWFKETYPGVKIPDRNSVKKELSVRWKCKPNSENCWGGLALKMPMASV